MLPRNPEPNRSAAPLSSGSIIRPLSSEVFGNQALRSYCRHRLDFRPSVNSVE
jgi:hypothetical protein